MHTLNLLYFHVFSNGCFVLFRLLCLRKLIGLSYMASGRIPTELSEDLKNLQSQPTHFYEYMNVFFKQRLVPQNPQSQPTDFYECIY